jgi:geranylgeranylglycerol-phosphate geranylgeranyltransferase
LRVCWWILAYIETERGNGGEIIYIPAQMRWKMGAANPIAEYMRLLRLWNGAIAALGLLLGIAVAIGLEGMQQSLVELLLGVVIVILFVGAGNSLNDFFDVETDRIAHPSRPLPKGTIPKNIALYSAGVMFAVSIALSFFLNLMSFVIVILAVLAMVGYELKLKSSGLAGNVMIALLVIGLFEFSGATVGHLEQTLILALLAGLATLGREIVKDIEDMEGDVSRRTLPKAIGAKKAGYLAIVPTATAVALSPMPFLLDQLTVFYLIVVAIADALFIYGCFAQFRSPNKGQKIYKWAMIVALLAFAVGVQI